MYLIDIDVLSALHGKNRDPRIVRWMETRRSADLYLSVVSIAEIESRIARLASSNTSSAQGQGLAAWLDSLIDLYSGHILSVDVSTAKRWGKLSSGVVYDGADLLVAATALERGLTLVTLRVPHFRPIGVPTVDPSALMVVA